MKLIAIALVAGLTITPDPDPDTTVVDVPPSVTPTVVPDKGDGVLDEPVLPAHNGCDDRGTPVLLRAIFGCTQKNSAPTPITDQTYRPMPGRK
jgi:hypothetical protein